MQDQSSICSNSIPDTHYFAYKDKLYPIKYDFFKYSSEYFRINEDEIKASKIIQLVEQNEHNINLSDNSIQNFIDFVQSKTITLTDENVSELNFLSRKYLVNDLTKYTEDYIKKHHKDLILQVLIYRQNDSEFETEIYEDTLINNFLDYIDKKQLLDLNFNIIHRILNKYISIQNEQETKSELYTADTKYIDFLFKCLDKYGREASILFNNIDIYKTGPKYLNKLLKEYSNTFDFHLLNSIFVKELYEKENQLFQKFCDHQDIEEKNKEELTKMSQTIKEFKYEVQQSFIDCSKETDQKLTLNLETVMKEIKGIKEEMEQMKSFYSKKLAEQKESINKIENQQEKKSINISNDIQSIKKEIEQIKSKQLDDQNISLKQTESQSNENLVKEINDLKSSDSKESNDQKQELNQEKEKNAQKPKSKRNIPKRRRLNKKGTNKKRIIKTPSDKASNNSPKEEKKSEQSQSSQDENIEKIEKKSSSSSSDDDDDDSPPVDFSQSLFDLRTRLNRNHHFGLFNDDSDDVDFHHFSMRNKMPQEIEPICTQKASGNHGIVQKWYRCRTCNLANGKGMCEVCAHSCHEGHDIVCEGICYDCFCDCPKKCNCKCCSIRKNHSCTREMFLGMPITQPMYICNSCDDDDYICQYCAINHHHGHNLRYLGIVENKVCCNDEIGRFSRSAIFGKKKRNINLNSSSNSSSDSLCD